MNGKEIQEEVVRLVSACNCNKWRGALKKREAVRIAGRWLRLYNGVN